MLLCKSVLVNWDGYPSREKKIMSAFQNAVIHALNSQKKSFIFFFLFFKRAFFALGCLILLNFGRITLVSHFYIEKEINCKWCYKQNYCKRLFQESRLSPVLLKHGISNLFFKIL